MIIVIEVSMTESVRITESIMMIEDAMMIEEDKMTEDVRMTEADMMTEVDKKIDVRMTEVVKRTEDLMMILMTKVQVLVTMTENLTVTIRGDTRDQLVDTTECKSLTVRMTDIRFTIIGEMTGETSMRIEAPQRRIEERLQRSFLPVPSICGLRTTKKMCLPPRSQR